VAGADLETVASLVAKSLTGNRAWLALRDGRLQDVEVLGAGALHEWSSERRAGPTVFQWSARFPLLAVDVERGRLDGAGEHARAMLDERQQPLPAEVQVALRAALERGTRRGIRGGGAAGRAGGYT
jgi:hypothetical protein